jgi:hypothetical protein
MHYCKRLGITAEGLEPRALRATSATNALSNGSDIAEVQEWLVIRAARPHGSTRFLTESVGSDAHLRTAAPTPTATASFSCANELTPFRLKTPAVTRKISLP